MDYSTAAQRDQLKQAAAAEEIAWLLIDVALLIALYHQPLGCPWQPP